MLYHKSKDTDMEIDSIIGDSVYSEKRNIELAQEEKINLVAKLNPSVSQGCRKKKMNFSLTKMPVCMSVKPDIWQSGSHVRVRKIKVRIGRNAITLMWEM